MKILGFAGSNSSTSINLQLVEAVGQLATEHEVNVIKLTDFDVPMYGVDLEKAEGIPADILKLDALIQAHDGVLVSVAEHNGNLAAYFKNIMDWLSRNNRKYLEGKKAFLLSTSPGGGGGATALELMKKTVPFLGAEIVGAMAVPSFNEALVDGKLTDKEREAEIADWF